jgi:hypothetical protein
VKTYSNDDMQEMLELVRCM